ncbi:MAG: 4-hydroxythreonine-4-phosphate dehydrogenase PdxA [Candidatus Erginobacter occultus]|nr:4-hydroxythreonine-4-phosphate dehydrogenase PdxA [Candidatus Erginobacter occultus]
MPPSPPLSVLISPSWSTAIPARWSGGRGFSISWPLDDLPEELPPPGKIDPAWARAAMEAVARGVELVMDGTADGLVTAPLNKEGIRRAGYPFQGHTDYLASLTGGADCRMMLSGGGIRVVLATVHVPLKEVSGLLSREGIVRTILLAREAMVRFGIARPRIAVAGLNPHAGEGGLFGNEEDKLISPAVAECRGQGMDVSGPLPPDTLFYQLARGRFDVAVVMYHDQGLIPLKMVAFETGVNITLGLPIVRTSPDHGTAYDIAGQGIADPASMIEALKVASRLAAGDG